jgi:hypothetical protein
MTKDHLRAIRQWADDKLAQGSEPPWAWYQYMKLRETLDAILAGMEATTPLGSPESGVRQEKHLHVVIDNAVGEIPVQLPL